MKSNITGRIFKIALLALTLAFIIGSSAFANDQEMVKIDLNSATVEELAKLPGIGKKKAEAIVAYRSGNGEFNSVDDLVKVDGIGEKVLEKIREHLTVAGG